MQDNKALSELTQKFINDFISLSGEESTYAINFILPEIMYPLLPEYKEPSNSIYMPMSYFETNMAQEGLKHRLKGWTNPLKDIVTTLESGKDMNFDRFRFENLTTTEIEQEVINIVDYSTLKCEKGLERFTVKSFDIISTTNFFKGTVSVIYRNETGLYPVKEVMLYCNGSCIFSWNLYEENGEKSHGSVDADNIKDLNSFYYYTADLCE